MIDPRSVPVRISNLKRMSRSPKHYLHAVREDMQTTRCMRVGTTTHALVLGGKYVVYPGTPNKDGVVNFNRQGGGWAKFEAAHPDERIVTRSEVLDAADISAAVRDNPLAKRLLSGETEVEIDFDWLGRSCQSHIDVLDRGPKIVADLKVTSDASPDRFPWQAKRMLYHAQMAFYRRAAGADACYIVAVEDKPPHDTTVWRLSDRALELGDRCCRLWMERLLVCEESNDWPGYAQVVQALDVPGDDGDPDADDGMLEQVA